MPSLYANLLNPDANKSATISSAPVKYDFKAKAETPAEEEKKAPDASLRFAPVKRPTANQKPRPRPSIPASISPLDKTAIDRKAPANVTGSSIDQWVNNDGFEEDPDAAEYIRKKEERKRAWWADKKKQKKNKKAVREVDWDAIYDPEQPVRLTEYKGSQEQADAAYEWKELLHAHQYLRSPAGRPSSEDEGRMPKKAFAPPSNYNFAPPVFDDPPSRTTGAGDSDEDEYVPTLQTEPSSKVEEDPYLRRMRMSGMQHEQNQSPLPTTPLAVANDAAAPPPPDQSAHGSNEFPPPPSAPPAPGTSAARNLPSKFPASATISAAPVRYEVPAQFTQTDNEPESSQGGLGFASNTLTENDDYIPSNEDTPAENDEDEEAPRSNRPGQKGFAKRLLQKYGWQEGQGLGATGSGITTILEHKMDKRKKRPAGERGEGGPPPTVGRIVGGKRRKVEGEAEEEQWSVVVRVDGMLDGLNVEEEMVENNLMQNIGDRVQKFGIAERITIDPEKRGSGTVFIKFTSALSAYRAIQASNGKDFMDNGRIATSGFFDADKFDRDVYS